MTTLATITDVGVHWPGWREVLDTLTLQRGYTATMVTLGTTALGAAGGVVGTFTLLRKRALMTDTLAHATLPGVAIAFLLLVALGAGGKSLLGLLPGAAASGVVGVLAVHALTKTGRLRPDAAMAVVLSVGFGIGVVLMSIIQAMPSGQQGGLSTFIYGQTAAMSREDVAVIGAAGALSVLFVVLVLKELSYVAFDAEHARVSGVPSGGLDLALMGVVVLVTVVALQAVGLVLAVAILVIPAVSARLWTDRLRRMVVLAGVLGALGGYLGTAASTVLERLPAGPVIVLCSGAIFAISLVFAPRRGVVAAAWRAASLRGRMARDHALRAIWELSDKTNEPWVTLADLAEHRGASRRTASAVVRVLGLRGLTETAAGRVRLTDRGEHEAMRITRNHRLWEQYLIAYADVAPTHVDVSAEYAEHALGASVVEALEAGLAKRGLSLEHLPDHSELIVGDTA
ncbi:MAG: manganese ABC transporter permease [Phycisphaeraceae bacterium]|nr:MAG: manganese ABC transporter permease [Phycisphaeraceae bacterium]